MKTRNEFKGILMVAALTFLGATSNSLAGEREGRGGIGTGGGDACENRIQEITEGLVKWIVGGGPRNGLKLPDGVSVEDYSKKMLDQIGKTFARCVKPGDNGYPIEVEGEPKVCKFKHGWRQDSITCDYDSFLNKTDANEQYRTIHHEYAGAVGLEEPNGPVSKYTITKQLDRYFVRVSDVRLSIEPNVPDANNLKKLFESGQEEFSTDYLMKGLNPREGEFSYYFIDNSGPYNDCAVEQNGKVSSSKEIFFAGFHQPQQGPLVKAKTQLAMLPFDIRHATSFAIIENFRDETGGLNAWLPQPGFLGAQTVYKIKGPYLVFYTWNAKVKNAPQSEKKDEAYGYCYKK